MPAERPFPKGLTFGGPYLQRPPSEAGAFPLRRPRFRPGAFVFLNFTRGPDFQSGRKRSTKKPALAAAGCAVFVAAGLYVPALFLDEPRNSIPYAVAKKKPLTLRLCNPLPPRLKQHHPGCHRNI